MQILFIAPLPPPITGHALAANTFYDEISKLYNVNLVNLSKDGLINGVSSTKRLFQVVKILSQVKRSIQNSDIIYFTISESLAGNIKDILIYSICYRKLDKMIVHLHGGSLKVGLFDKHPFLFWLNRIFLRRIGAVIVLGDSHLEIFKRVVSSDKIFAVPNSAQNDNFFDEFHIINKFKSIRPLKILFLSNLISGKGYNDLVSAYIKMDKTIQRHIFIDFAGSFESKKDEISFLCQIEHYSNIRYHGLVNGDKKRKLLSSAHLFCLPTTLHEGQPISIIEAYAAGCVVITTLQGGIPDIFSNEVNGFAIEPNNPNSITKVITKCLNIHGQLREIAISNHKEALSKYDTSMYNRSMLKIVENIRLSDAPI